MILPRQRTTKALIRLHGCADPRSLISAFVVRLWQKQVFSWLGLCILGILWIDNEKFGSLVFEETGISPLCVWAHLGSRETSQVLHAGGFSRGSPVFVPPYDWRLKMSEIILTGCKTQLKKTEKLVCDCFHLKIKIRSFDVHWMMKLVGGAKIP